MSFIRVEDLLGAWRLESAVEVFDDGERREGGRLSIIASDRTSADGRTFHSELVWLRV